MSRCFYYKIHGKKNRGSWNIVFQKLELKTIKSFNSAESPLKASRDVWKL